VAFLRPSSLATVSLPPAISAARLPPSPSTSPFAQETAPQPSPPTLPDLSTLLRARLPLALPVLRLPSTLPALSALPLLVPPAVLVVLVVPVVLVVLVVPVVLVVLVALALPAAPVLLPVLVLPVPLALLVLPAVLVLPVLPVLLAPLVLLAVLVPLALLALPAAPVLLPVLVLLALPSPRWALALPLSPSPASPATRPTLRLLLPAPPPSLGVLVSSLVSLPSLVTSTSCRYSVEIWSGSRGVRPRCKGEVQAQKGMLQGVWYGVVTSRLGTESLI